MGNATASRSIGNHRINFFAMAQLRSNAALPHSLQHRPVPFNEKGGISDPPCAVNAEKKI
jgi:hypothetical protein